MQVVFPGFYGVTKHKPAVAQRRVFGKAHRLDDYARLSPPFATATRIILRACDPVERLIWYAQEGPLWLVAAYLLVLGERSLHEIKGSGSKWAERGQAG